MQSLVNLTHDIVMSIAFFSNLEFITTPHCHLLATPTCMQTALLPSVCAPTCVPTPISVVAPHLLAPSPSAITPRFITHPSSRSFACSSSTPPWHPPPHTVPPPLVY